MQSKGLPPAEPKLRASFWQYAKRHWSQFPILHIMAVVWLGLTYIHLNHLYRVQEVRSAGNRVANALNRMESSQRGFLLTNNPLYLGDFGDYKRVLDERLETLCKTMPKNPSNNNVCTSLKRLLKLKVDEMQHTIDLVNVGQSQQALNLVKTDQGLHYMFEIQYQISRVRTEESMWQALRN